MREMIRNNEVIEWGEYDNQVYGTTVESVREVVR